MTDEVLNPGETRPLAPVIDMIATPPKKPYKDMSNSEKLAELEHKDAVISVLRHTIAEQEIALENARNEAQEIQAKYTRFSRVIHANACLEIGARILVEQYNAGKVVGPDDMDLAAMMGISYADAIQRQMDKIPDSDSQPASNEPVN